VSRFLIVVPPLTGHINPLRPVAAELISRGHEVAWVGPAPEVTKLCGGERVYPAGDSEPFDVDKRPTDLRGFAALKYLWEQYLVPLADAMVPGVLAAIDDFSPDALICDQQAMAGPIAAGLRGLPWATSASTSSELSDPVGQMPKVAAWIDGLQAELRQRHGLAEDHHDLRFSPYLVLAFTSKELAGEPTVQVGEELIHYVGPAIGDRHGAGTFDLSRLDGRPLVFITLGTANAPVSERFLRAATQACLPLVDRIQAVIVDPGNAIEHASAVGALSTDILIAARVPQLEIIEKAAVVLCHGGHNTVCESLSNGVPLIVAPIRDDQPIIAEQVVNAGAGIRLRFDRAQENDIRQALLTVLSDPSYTAKARSIKESFDMAEGPKGAADALFVLASNPRTQPK